VEMRGEEVSRRKKWCFLGSLCTKGKVRKHLDAMGQQTRDIPMEGACHTHILAKVLRERIAASPMYLQILHAFNNVGISGVDLPDGVRI